MYIVRFLHQTTTVTKPRLKKCCCISSVSYIKPQLKRRLALLPKVVYRPFPTSNHNNAEKKAQERAVVYRPFPTSNHNLMSIIIFFLFRCISSVSYIKPQLPLIKAIYDNSCISSVSYIKPQLPLIKAIYDNSCISSVSYIKPQLIMGLFKSIGSCISSVSYIKPQPDADIRDLEKVVYRPFPTSNHNLCR